jgi:hypothetical protein
MPPRWPITAPATVTLAGLRIDRAERTPAHLHDQLIPWRRIASLRETLALPLDARGRPLRHDGRRVSLKLPSSRAGRLANRALRRAIARAFNDGSITIRGDWSREQCDVRAGAAVVTICIAGLIAFFIASAAAVARDLLGSPFPMLALGAVAGLMVSVGIVALAFGIAPVWRQASILRFHADFRGLRLVLTGARRRRVAWTQLRAVIPEAMMLRLESGAGIWLPLHHRALRELLCLVQAHYGLRRRFGPAAVFWTFLLLVLPVLGALAIWWNTRVGLLPPAPPQTLLVIALAPASIGLLYAILLHLTTRRTTRRTTRHPRRSRHQPLQ